LALCVADRIAILEHAVLSVISPKAYAEILWKDTSREIEAAELLKMTSSDLFPWGKYPAPWGG
jgi:acetyl-CoA carboxylase carboxyl transferase subunit alpha